MRPASRAGRRVVACRGAIGSGGRSASRGEGTSGLRERVSLVAGAPAWRLPMTVRAPGNLIATAGHELNRS